MRSKWVGLVLERGQESSLSPTPPLPQQCRTDEEMLMTTGHPWRGEKNRYKPPVCFMICLYWNHIFLHNQNRIILQIRVLNLKTSCKVQEGWKKYKKGAFSFHHDLQPKPQEQSKPFFALSWKEPNPAVLLHLISREPHQESKKGSEGRGSLLAAFLLYPSPKKLAPTTGSPNLHLMPFQSVLRNTDWEEAPSWHQSPLPLRQINCHILQQVHWKILTNNKNLNKKRKARHPDNFPSHFLTRTMTFTFGLCFTDKKKVTCLWHSKAVWRPLKKVEGN